jgi:hypothetical protein
MFGTVGNTWLTVDYSSGVSFVPSGSTPPTATKNCFFQQYDGTFVDRTVKRSVLITCIFEKLCNYIFFALRKHHV